MTYLSAIHAVQTAVAALLIVTAIVAAHSARRPAPRGDGVRLPDASGLHARRRGHVSALRDGARSRGAVRRARLRARISTDPSAAAGRGGPDRRRRGDFECAPHPGTGELVRDFESCTSSQYHLFVISQDMEHFQHIHPELQPTAPGRSTSRCRRPATTCALGFHAAGRLVAAHRAAARHRRLRRRSGSDGARLVPDTNLMKVLDDLTATFSFDPPAFVAGLYGHLTFI